jgi:hypothetical protein
MTVEQKAWIDKSAYDELLQRWKFAPPGDPMFMGDIGKYYMKVMDEKRHTDPEGVARARAKMGG